MKSEPVVWIAGDYGHASFAEALAWLKKIARCVAVDDATSLARLSALGSPVAILLMQSRPGQISGGDVERLHAAEPLARLVALVGEWCDGEGRSGQPLPGVVRVPVSAWRWRLEQELGLVEHEVRGCGLLPRTMSGAERLEASLSSVRRRENGSRITATVFSSRRASYEAIADMLGQLGVHSTWKSEVAVTVPAVDLVAFDGWELSPAGCHASANGAEREWPPRILLMSFPREEDYARAAGEGIAEVLALPVGLADLATAIRKTMSHAAEPRASASGLY